jgi:hypothetical protein
MLCLTMLLVLAPFSVAAPALPDKPPKWEYAELTYRTTLPRAAGVDADGKEIPAVPAAVTVRWISGDGEVEAKSWSELAEKLRASRFKKDGSAAYQKIQILNYLGSEGWELMEQLSSSSIVQTVGGFGKGERPGPVTLRESPPSHTWLLKRRVP